MKIDSNQVAVGLLKALRDFKRPAKPSELYEVIANDLGLSESERNERYPKSRDFVFSNKIRWARLHLINAGLLKSAGRGAMGIN